MTFCHPFRDMVSYVDTLPTAYSALMQNLLLGLQLTLEVKPP